MFGLADFLGPQGAGNLGRFGAAGLTEYRQQDDPASWCQPVRDPGLPGQQMEPQLADLPTEMPRVRLAQRLGRPGSRRGQSPGHSAQSARTGPQARLRRCRDQPCITCYAFDAISRPGLRGLWVHPLPRERLRTLVNAPRDGLAGLRQGASSGLIRCSLLLCRSCRRAAASHHGDIVWLAWSLAAVGCP